MCRRAECRRRDRYTPDGEGRSARGQGIDALKHCSRIARIDERRPVVAGARRRMASSRISVSRALPKLRDRLIQRLGERPAEHSPSALRAVAVPSRVRAGAAEEPRLVKSVRQQQSGLVTGVEIVDGPGEVHGA